MTFGLFQAVLHPFGFEQMRSHFEEGRRLVVEGPRNKFKGLVSLADIERRLNEGCNANIYPQVIKHGARTVDVEPRCAWAPSVLRKIEFSAAIEQGHSFMMANSSQITPDIARLCDDIEGYFSAHHMCADVHLYVSTSASGNSYDTHRDLPQHKILRQAFGDTNWQIFRPKKDIPEHIRALTDEQQADYLELEAEFTLSQGDLLYMPPGTFHRVVSVAGLRISISIPFFSMPQAQPMDRSHIPFMQLFSAANNTNIDIR